MNKKYLCILLSALVLFVSCGSNNTAGDIILSSQNKADSIQEQNTLDSLFNSVNKIVESSNESIIKKRTPYEN